MPNLNEILIGESRAIAKVHRFSPSNLYQPWRVQAFTWKTDQQKVYAEDNHCRLVIKKDNIGKDIEKSGIQKCQSYQTGTLHLLKNWKLLRQTVQNIPSFWARTINNA